MREPIPAYTPRWLFRFFKILNNLPVPFWTLAILYALVMAVVRHLVGWQRGLIPQGEWNAFLAVNPLFSLAAILYWQYLDRQAQQALAAFNAGSGKSRRAVQQATSEFLSLRTWPATILFALGLVMGYLNFLDTMNQMEPGAAQVWPAVSIFGFSLTVGLFLLIIYRLVRQIGLMRQMLNTTQADIFNPYPVYALSNYGAAFALAGLITYLVPSLPLPNTIFTTSGLFILAAVSVAVLVIFFAPLFGISARMRTTKERLLARTGNNLRNLSERLNKSVETGKFAEADRMRGSLSALREERELIQKTQTWPWQPETLRNVLTPLLIPVIVYLVQRYVGAMFGF